MDRCNSFGFVCHRAEECHEAKNEFLLFPIFGAKMLIFNFIRKLFFVVFGFRQDSHFADTRSVGMVGTCVWCVRVRESVCEWERVCASYCTCEKEREYSSMHMRLGVSVVLECQRATADMLVCVIVWVHK